MPLPSLGLGQRVSARIHSGFFSFPLFPPVPYTSGPSFPLPLTKFLPPSPKIEHGISSPVKPPSPHSPLLSKGELRFRSPFNATFFSRRGLDPCSRRAPLPPPRRMKVAVLLPISKGEHFPKSHSSSSRYRRARPPLFFFPRFNQKGGERGSLGYGGPPPPPPNVMPSGHFFSFPNPNPPSKSERSLSIPLEGGGAALLFFSFSPLPLRFRGTPSPFSPPSSPGRPPHPL